MPTLAANGVELHHMMRGEGLPLLCIHETATSAAVWEPLTAAVAGGVRVVAYDRRGWGGSTAPEGYARSTVEEHSEDAAALLDHFGDDDALVCGAGLGAVVALDLLLRHPHLARAGVLIEPPLLAFVPAATEALSDDRIALEKAIGDGGPAAGVKLYLSGKLAALGAGAGRLPAQISAPAGDRPRSLFAELGAVPGWGVSLGQLRACERPTVAVVSSSTPRLLEEAAQALAQKLTGCELRRIGTDGPAHLSAPGDLAELVLELAEREG